MLVRLLQIFTMIASLSTQALACNYKLLELEADSFHTKIWSGVLITESLVKENLAFLRDEKDISQTPAHPEGFYALYQDITDKIKDKRFQQFADICKNIYESNNNLTKASVYMLLQKVGDKSLKELNTLKKLAAFKRQDSRREHSDIGSKLDFFLNADKTRIAQ